MGWLERWGWRRAALGYARRLGLQLRQDYGGGGLCTAAQVETAVGKLGLDRRYIGLGYAQFCDPETFAARQPALAKPIEREAARRLFKRYKRGPVTNGGPSGETIGSDDLGDYSGDGGGHHGGHH
jgi:hypothetical protein